MSLAARLELGIAALAISQAELARRAGLPNRTVISQLKRGDVPGHSYVGPIAKALNCTVEWLVNGTGMPPTWSRDPGTVSPAPLSPSLESIPDAMTALILRRIDQLESLLLARLPLPESAHHDETIRAGMAIADPPGTTTPVQPAPQESAS